jgi:hypothetical protein
MIGHEQIDAIRRRFGAAWPTLRETDGKKEMRLKTLDELRPALEERGRFLFIKGEEISDEFKNKPIHHNSINHVHLIRPTKGASVREILQRTIDAVQAEAEKCGRPVLVHLNHPNFHWAVTPDDIAHVLGERYFEVYNGHPLVRNYGDADHKSAEDLWDYVLAMRLGKLGGDVLYALATDDAHDYFGPKNGPPGRGWVMVRAAELSADHITKAMLAGDFYATSGVTLEEVVADEKSLTVKIAAAPGVSYTTRFVGSKLKGGGVLEIGAVLKEVKGASASYAFAGDELYVRATVVSDRPHPNPYQAGDVETAWVQPARVRR